MKFILANSTKDEHGVQFAAHIELPATKVEISMATTEMKLDGLKKGNFEIIGTSLGNFESLLKYMPLSNVDLNELNLLAYKLEGFKQEQSEDYLALLTDREGVSVKDLINFACDIATEKYDFWHGDSDLADVGRHYVEDEAPNLPDVILSNISYENVGNDLQVSEDGKITKAGYIRNFNERFEPTYTGNNLDELLSTYTSSELHTVKFFSPLFVRAYPSNEYGECGIDDPLEELSSYEVLQYKDKILAAIEREKLGTEKERGLMVYFDRNNAIEQKVLCADPTVEEYNDELWGVMVTQMHGGLTAQEQEILTDYFAGQYSDGWGEGLEQRPIKVDSGEIYVSFWNSDSFLIRTEEKLKQDFCGQTMGGM